MRVRSLPGFSATVMAERQSLTRRVGAAHGRPMQSRRIRMPLTATAAKERALSSADVLLRSTKEYFLLWRRQGPAWQTAGPRGRRARPAASGAGCVRVRALLLQVTSCHCCSLLGYRRAAHQKIKWSTL